MQLKKQKGHFNYKRLLIGLALAALVAVCGVSAFAYWLVSMLNH